MAVYAKLNLNNEGGIIDVLDQATQANCAVLCIGLGGTGCDCLRNLKAKVYNRVRPDNSTEENPNPAVPQYDHIQYLAIDTDDNGFNVANSKCADFSRLNSKEFFKISYSANIMDYLHDNQGAIQRNTSLNNWFRSTDVKIAGNDGAGQVRQIGRFLLMSHASNLVDTITSRIQSAMKGLTDPKVYIHIFSGLGGGTGAGTFLDVCYLARTALSRAGISAAVLGYFFLPDVNIARGLSPEDKAGVQENGYSSLSELDYCMNFAKNGDSWKQEYPGLGLITNSKPPVDICHLISATDKSGNVIPDGYNYAMNVVTEYFMDFVISSADEFSLSSHISNFDAKKSQVKKDNGATFEYLVLGASTATIPFKEVLTYLASGMFKKLSSVVGSRPENTAVDAFVRENQLDFDDILRKLTNRCSMAFTAEDHKWQDAKSNPQLTVPHFEELYAQYLNRLDTNYNALVRDLDSYVASTDVDKSEVRSLIASINDKLQDIASNPDYGPFYAAAILQSTTGTDLIAKVNGIKSKATEKLEHQSYQESRSGGLYDEYKRTETDFFNNSNMLSGSGKYKAFVNAVANLYKNRAQVRTYERMLDIAKKLDDQLHSLSNKFMIPFTEVVNNLFDTFKENSKYIEGVLDGSIVTKSYEMPIATIADMKPQMDQTLDSMDVKEKFRELMKELLKEEGIKAWTSGNENSICVVVNRFFTKLFSDYSRMTIDKYLEQKFNVTDPDQLIVRIEQSIMNELYTRANPMYWVSNSYNISTASPLGYVTCPSTSSTIQVAATKLADRCSPGELKTRPGSVYDRISIMRCLVGVPMYGYQGIANYETNAVASAKAGKHLYEGLDYVDGNGKAQKGLDWRYLPSPTPLTLMNSSNSPILMENAKKAAELYKKAVSLGIIFNEEGKPNEYYVRTVTDQYLDEIKSIRDKNINRSILDKTNAVAELEHLRDNKQYNSGLISIDNECSPDLGTAQKEDARIDHFVKSPKIQDMVRREIERLESIDAIIEDLRPKIDKDLKSFQRAVLSGVISYDPETKIVEYEYGYGDKVVLSEPAKGIIATAVPLFMALHSFKDLDGTMKDEINEKSDKVLTNFPLPDSVKEAFTKIKTDMSKDSSILKVASNSFPEKVDELKEFYKSTISFIEEQEIIIFM